MVLRRSISSAIIALALSLAAIAVAQPHQSNLLESLRARHITPRIHPPKSIDWARIESACAFSETHAQSIGAALGTTSLVSTFACRDIEPVLVYTGRLVDDFDKRLQETGAWVDEIRETPKSKADFLAHNYKRAYDLGVMHLDLSEAIKPKDLGWNANERVAMNGQAVAFVLYCFAWEPIENMEAMHEISATKDAKAINDYLYFWNVVGYAMGVDEKLLPKNARQSLSLMTELRTLQYYKAGETPKATNTMIKNWMDNLYPAFLQGKPINDQSKAQVRAAIAQQIAISPGLSQALGFGTKPQEALDALAQQG